MTKGEMDWQDDTVAAALGKPRVPKEKTRVERIGIAVETSTRGEGGMLASVSGRMARKNTTTALLYIPNELYEDISRRCSGPKASVCVGLMEWALQELETRKLTLNIALGLKVED